MALKKHLPPMDGSINVLPGFVDFHAEHNPSLPWAKFPSAKGDGTADALTFLEFSRATHRVAHALRPGRQDVEGEIVAVLIHCDSILYLALLAGMVRAGFVPFPMSPRNSPEAVCQMLQKTSCHRIVINPAMSSLVSAVQSMMTERQASLKIIQLPDLRTVFPALNGGVDKDVETYPSRLAPVDIDDAVIILHSSGSTGFPKPIPQTHRTILQWCLTPIVYQSRERNIPWASTALPTFHTMGIMQQFYAPLATGEFAGLYTPMAPAPPVVPNAQNILETCKITGCRGIPMVPSFIEVWAQSPENVKYLASLDMLAFAGGPLSDTNGGKLAAAGVKLFAVYGGTEFGVPTTVFDIDDSQGPDADVKTSADWAWMQFVDTVKIRWIPQGDGTYELHLLTCETHQPAIENLPDVKGYATSDLWEPHPTKKDLWRIVGRADDVIVLGSGEKIVPIPQEGYLGSLPYVAGVIMFGRGQTQAGVLIEPRPEFAFDPSNEKALTEFRNKIWPSVEDANKLAPSFARIFKEMILVTDPKKPMARAGKGTVMRKMVVSSYTQEIDQLYDTIAVSTSDNGVEPPSSWNVEDVEEWLTQHASAISKGQQLVATVDIFEQGFDSLGATFLRNRILGALRSSSLPAAREAVAFVSQEFVFTHPTLQHLARAIVHLIYPQESAEQPKSGKDEIVDLIAKYSDNLPQFKVDKQATVSDGAVVLLTGSTGNLGSHILAALLQSDRVKKVFTLDRGTTPLGRLKSSFSHRGIPDRVIQSDKLVALVGDLSKPALGLDGELLHVIQNSVNHIIHNAWKLDFNLSVSSFQSHIAGTRTLVDFSATCASPVKFLFSSSIAAAQNWKVDNGPVPEEVLSNPDVAVGTGYGSSKYVAECVLAEAKARGLDTLSVRIGQLSGSTTSGAWNVTDWVPIIVKSSIALGYLPDLRGVVDWTPVDVAANTIVDVVSSSGPLPDVINLVHPRPTSWSSVFAAVNSSVDFKLHVVPFSEWLSKVEARSANTNEQDFDDIPAIKLLLFLRGISAAADRAPDAPVAGGNSLYESLKAQKISSTLQNARTIDSRDVDLWLKYWQRQQAVQRTVS